MKIRFGYVAMSEELVNASPSQTVTATQFEKIDDREAGLRKLERVARSNLEHCLRLLKHNKGNGISFFRLSSRIVPLVNHPLTKGWRYEKVLREDLKKLGSFALKEKMRIDFHPDHFVVLNSPSEELTKKSIMALAYHYKLLQGMGINPIHRCVLHVGGKKQGIDEGLEQFIENFSNIPKKLQQMMILENDDTNYTIDELLYLGEKLDLPIVLDLHHHDVHHHEASLLTKWERIVKTWKNSPLPVKIHLSSPRNGAKDKRHHDFVHAQRLVTFLKEITNSLEELDVMIEAKKKDVALFQLIDELKEIPSFSHVTGAQVTYQYGRS